MSRPPSVFVSAGQRFGRAVVVNPDVPRYRRGAQLRCDCGVEFWTALSNLVNGHTTSCGCLRREMITTGYMGTANPNYRHGLHWRTYPLHGTWMRMIGRCENPAARGYHNYGGRGIRVCEQWHDIAVFAADIDRLIGPRPDGCTLDRIDNDGNYEPGNVRWATPKQQAANSRPRRIATRPTKPAEVKV